MSTELILWIKKILILIIILVIGYTLYLLQSLLLVLLISAFITILITPLIDLLEKKHIHASITIIGIYLIVLVIASIVMGTIIPIIITYVTDTVNIIVNWVNEAQAIYNTTHDIKAF